MTLFVNDPDFTLYVGDALEVLQAMPAESVHCCVTSPPYWGLRDYGTGMWEGGDADCDHLGKPFRTKSKLNENWGAGYSDVKNAEDTEPMGQSCSKCGARRVDQQLGLEPTPDEYVTNMVNVFREVRRVLRADGTLWLNIGDSYASNWPCQRRNEIGSGSLENGKREARPARMPDGLKEKDLVGIPWRLAFALQADGWYLRSDIIWSKPNPMPESVTDRPTKAHEYLFLLTKSPRYFYDADAIREPAEWARWGAQNGAGKYAGEHSGAAMIQSRTKMELQKKAEGSGRNKRSVWEIATEAYPDAHFATFPQALVEPCIKAGTSEHGCCPVCGAPWERQVERTEFTQKSHSTKRQEPGMMRQDGDRNLGGQQFNKFKRENPDRLIGWRPTCDRHAKVNTNYPVPCTVLDPFLGSGTTAQVARRLGRRCVGIELNVEYAQLAARRLQQLSLFAVEPAEA